MALHAKHYVEKSRQLLLDYYDQALTNFHVIVSYYNFSIYYRNVLDFNRSSFYSEIISVFLNKWRNRNINEDWERSLSGQIYNIRVMALEASVEYEQNEDLSMRVKRAIFGSLLVKYHNQLMNILDRNKSAPHADQNLSEVQDLHLLLAIKADIDEKTNTHFKIDLNMLDRLCSKFDIKMLNTLVDQFNTYKYGKTCMLLLFAQGAKIEILMCKSQVVNVAMKSAADFIAVILEKAPGVASQPPFTTSILYALQVHLMYLSSLHDRKEQEKVIEMVRTEIKVLHASMTQFPRVAQEHLTTVDSFEKMLQIEEERLHQEQLHASVQEFIDEPVNDSLTPPLENIFSSEVDEFFHEFFTDKDSDILYTTLIEGSSLI
jgi:hypothetical protein